jgi:hypothetical protein
MRNGLVVILAAAAAAGAIPASAQRRPTVTIMPTQYFAAHPQSADRITRGLAEQFERRGYWVIPLDRTTKRFRSMGLSRRRHYPDRVALRFGRRVGADLVVYPRLLTVGTPAPGSRRSRSMDAADAVVHVRVLNATTGAPLYFRQIGYDFRVDEGMQGVFPLPEPVADAAAGEATESYFQRVAGSREERRGNRR